MKEHTLVFDMDDVIADTNSYMIDEVIRLTENDPRPVMQELRRHFLIHKNIIHTLSLRSEFVKHAPELHAAFEEIMAEVMASGEFMSKVRANLAMVNYISSLQFDSGLVVRKAICTHRGFHVEAETRTRGFLREYGVEYLFDDFHVLDFRKVPNKVDFLNTYYGKDWTLVDDNPIVGGDIHPWIENLIVFHGRHKPLPSYRHQVCTGNIIDLNRFIQKRISGWKREQN